METMAGFFAELHMNSGLFGQDGRGLSKNRKVSGLQTRRVLS